MVRAGSSVFVRAVIVVGLLSGTFSTRAFATDEDRAAAVSTTLAVQAALRQGREQLLHQKSKEAVAVLESQLSHIDGNPYYLIELRNAYRAYIRELQLANQETTAQIYLQRLRILEPDSTPAKDLPLAKTTLPSKTFPGTMAQAKTELAGRSTSGTVVNPAKGLPVSPPATAASLPPPLLAKTTPAPTAPAAVAPVRQADLTARPSDGVAPKFVARGYADDPFNPREIQKANTPSQFLLQAEKEFGLRNYREAGQLFEKAYLEDSALAPVSKERWAYCKLHNVVVQLNQVAPNGAPFAEMEAEVRRSLVLAPRLSYAHQLLGEIEDRKKSSSGTKTSSEAAITLAVRHTERNADGWALAETTNFRIFHNQGRDFAEKAARLAEHTRAAMQRKWFGVAGEDWNPKCELYLHATGADYSRATGVPAESPGHSSFRIEGGRVVSRRVDLHCDNPLLLTAVMPHETTHTVLAGNFGNEPIPRWADEGMAVLTEPREQIERHLRTLPQHRDNQLLFSVQQLMEMNEYPEPRYLHAFYAQSVSVVDFMVKEKGPEVFSHFVRDGLRGGYEPALQRHYGVRNFAELEQRWLGFAFGEGNASRNSAQR